jgi:hypothetical protein
MVLRTDLLYLMRERRWFCEVGGRLYGGHVKRYQDAYDEEKKTKYASPGNRFILTFSRPVIY